MSMEIRASRCMDSACYIVPERWYIIIIKSLCYIWGAAIRPIRDTDRLQRGIKIELKG